jgi:hypothetical protein
MPRPPELWTLMDIAALCLAVPQGDVRTLEAVLDVRLHSDGLGVGIVELEGRALPVFCLNQELSPCASLPATHRICVMLSAHGSTFGLSCERVRNVPAGEIRFTALPRAMASIASPIHALGVHQNRVVCITSAAALHALLVREGWRPEVEMAAA